MASLTQITSAQAGKEITANANLAAVSPAALFSRRDPGTTGLTWAYYGGAFTKADGSRVLIANGSLTLTASSTRYLEANPADGTVAAVPTTFTAGRIPLYKVVTGTATVTSYEDWREVATRGHTHTIADTTGLQAALDSKLDDSQATASGLALLGATDVAAQRSALGLANHEKVVVDAAGNLGIGVTPSGWGVAGYKVVEIGAPGNALLSGNNEVWFTLNAFHDGAGWKYKANYPATAIVQNNGEFRWVTSPYGTAGAAINFTQAMTLDASGNLKTAGVVTSPEFKTDKPTTGTLGGEGSGVQMSDYQNGRHARLELGADNKVRLFILIGGSWIEKAVWG